MKLCFWKKLLSSLTKIDTEANSEWSEWVAAKKPNLWDKENSSYSRKPCRKLRLLTRYQIKQERFTDGWLARVLIQTNIVWKMKRRNLQLWKWRSKFFKNEVKYNTEKRVKGQVGLNKDFWRNKVQGFFEDKKQIHIFEGSKRTRTDLLTPDYQGCLSHSSINERAEDSQES